MIGLDDPDDRRRLVALLVLRSGLPALPHEVDALMAGAARIDEAVRRLYAVEMDHETGPAVALTHAVSHRGPRT
jgi:hypothetical protein